MPYQSRCFTVRPAAAPREGFTVLVVDKSVSEAERMCAVLRRDGHLAEARTYDDDLVRVIEELKPQAVALRMRLGSASRNARAQIERLFPHLLLITFNGASASAVREQLPRHWTDLFELAASRRPPLYGFPRALRDEFEETLRAKAG
jgi:hypothetical protein